MNNLQQIENCQLYPEGILMKILVVIKARVSPCDYIIRFIFAYCILVGLRSRNKHN